MTPDDHNPTPPAPTPTLPPEVREAIARILHCWEALPHPGVGTKQLCAALAPLWPRPAPVTADARELAERICALAEVVRKDGGEWIALDVAKVAAVVGPVLARAVAAERERDDLRAEIVRLEKNLYTGDDEEKQALRAQLAAAQTNTERLDWLATRCYLPGDHPDDRVLVVVPEKFAPLGSFTLSPQHDAAALRVAIDAARREGGRHD